MPLIKILQYPDKKLRRVARKVTDFNDPQLQQMIDDMFETHYNTENCAALAATQLDIDEPPAVTVIDFSEEKNQPLCLVNPVITPLEGKMLDIEGCMSVGEAYVAEKRERAAKVQVNAFDRHGKAIEFIAEGFMAKCVQHETDHLNGKLFIDDLSRLKRNRIEKKIKKFNNPKKFLN